MFGNHMVLQQNSKVNFWGYSKKNNKIKVTTTWDNRSYSFKSDENGVWKIDFITLSAGGPYKIKIDDGDETILEDVLLGEVWICSGQSNMAMALEGVKGLHIANGLQISNSADLILNADNDKLRLFTVKGSQSSTPLDTCRGEWSTDNSYSAGKFSALGYQFGLMLQKYLKVPVGIINASVGGSPIRAWADSETIRKFPEQTNLNTTQNRFKSSGFYNGMLHSWKNIPVKGFLWYQGEADVLENITSYEKILPEMVKGWRSTWNNDSLYFYLVQIAPWYYTKKEEFLGVYMREAQVRAQKNIPLSGIAITTDVGYNKNIHPPDKTTIAKRLLYMALSNAYGVKGITWQAPEFKQLTIKDREAILEFNYAPLGMYIKDGCSECFEIAGKDKVFYPASAKVNANQTVTVFSSKVESPVAVRYAFKSYTDGSLYSTEGLPASSFRTDNWNK